LIFRVVKNIFNFRSFLERGIQLLCAWIPGPLGIIIRAVFYKPLFHRNSERAFIETNTELFHMDSISFGKSVYVDKNCRLHASRAAIELRNNNRLKRGVYLSTYVSDACKGEGIKTGSGCWIGINIIFNTGIGGIFLGDNVLIAPNVVIVSYKGEFKLDSLTEESELIHHGSSIHIGDNVIIYANVVIGGGANIGANSIIAAGSVVTGDVAPFSFVGGIPAKKIRDIKRD
jgi:acetyltransferase-like isoleucine patch superfamily enzyme